MCTLSTGRARTELSVGPEEGRRPEGNAGKREEVAQGTACRAQDRSARTGEKGQSQAPLQRKKGQKRREGPEGKTAELERLRRHWQCLVLKVAALSTQTAAVGEVRVWLG